MHSYRIPHPNKRDKFSGIKRSTSPHNNGARRRSEPLSLSTLGTAVLPARSGLELNVPYQRYVAELEEIAEPGDTEASQAARVMLNCMAWRYVPCGHPLPLPMPIGRTEGRHIRLPWLCLECESAYLLDITTAKAPRWYTPADLPPTTIIPLIAADPDTVRAEFSALPEYGHNAHTMSGLYYKLAPDDCMIASYGLRSATVEP